LDSLKRQTGREGGVGGGRGRREEGGREKEEKEQEKEQDEEKEKEHEEEEDEQALQSVGSSLRILLFNTFTISTAQLCSHGLLSSAACGDASGVLEDVAEQGPAGKHGGGHNQGSAG
jgi:hypothetical protein